MGVVVLRPERLMFRRGREAPVKLNIGLEEQQEESVQLGLSGSRREEIAEKVVDG